MPASEFAKGVHNQPMPGHRRGNSDPKCTGFAKSYPLGTAPCLVDVLQDASRIVQEQRPCRAQSNSSRQSVEEEESDLSLQILDLTRQGRLREMQARGRSSEMLLLSNRDEIA